MGWLPVHRPRPAPRSGGLTMMKGHINQHRTIRNDNVRPYQNLMLNRSHSPIRKMKTTTKMMSPSLRCVFVHPHLPLHSDIGAGTTCSTAATSRGEEGQEESEGLRKAGTFANLRTCFRDKRGDRPHLDASLSFCVSCVMT